jgi:hypothetical protein
LRTSGVICTVDGPEETGAVRHRLVTDPCYDLRETQLLARFPAEVRERSGRPLAKRESKDFVCGGKVGTGLNRKSSIEIHKRLDAIVSSKSR